MTQSSLFEDAAAGRPKMPRRRPRDAYYTPTHALDALIDREPVRGHTLLDPCCGDGRMAFALRKRFRILLLNDLASPQLDVQALAAEGCRVSVFNRDATLDESPVWGWAPDWVITNPPWNLASEIAQLALRYSTNVALLLRLTFLEATKNRQWLCEHPPKALIVLPRISFNGTGQTDSCVPAWLLWGKWITRPGIHIVGKVDAGQLGLALSQ